MNVAPLCGFCCRRDAVQVDEDDHVPICEVCRDVPTPAPKLRSSADISRVLRVITRDPGLGADEIAERLCIERPRVSEILSRLESRGLIRHEGLRRTRTYYPVPIAAPQTQQLSAIAAA